MSVMGADKSEFVEVFMKRKIDYAWCISSIVVGIATVILNGSNIVGIDLPDWLTRSMGIIDLVAVFVLIFTTIRKAIKKQ